MIKNIAIYLCLLASALCFNIFYYAWFSWFLLAALLAIPFVSLVCSLPFMILCAAKGFEVYTPSTAFAGQPLEISVKYKGNGAAFCPLFRLKMRVKLKPYGKTKKLKFTGSGSLPKPVVKSYPTPTEHCGSVEINAKWVKVYDFTGVFFIPVRLPLHLFVCVLPRPQRPRLMPDADCTAVIGYKPVPAGASDIYDLREYRSGDSVRSIHWKLSSKTDNLIIREAVAPVTKPFAVKPELTGNAADNDKILSKLIYICEYMIDETGKCLAVSPNGVCCLKNKTDIERYFSALYDGGSHKPCAPNTGEARVYRVFPEYEEVSEN